VGLGGPRSQSSLAFQDFGEQAGGVRRNAKHDGDGSGEVGGKILGEADQRLDTACGCPDDDDTFL